MNFRSGPKWYSGVITEKLGSNLYNVFVKDLNVTWRRHTNQMLSSVSNSNNSTVSDENYNTTDFITVPTSNSSVPVVNQHSHSAGSTAVNTGNVSTACTNAQTVSAVPQITPNSPINSSSSGDESFSDAQTTFDVDVSDRTLPRRSNRTRNPVDRFKP